MNETPENILGSSAPMKDLRKSITKAARTNMTILIQGESGTGKELVAAAVHRASRRAPGPYVALNCGSLPQNLIESELYGYQKGAFTGADADRKGKFELAHGGTIFLDELGELSLDAQIKLLRVLETKEIDRVGSQRSIPVDFRLIAATHRDLAAMVKAGTFREDLYYRLNVCVIQIPPLRDRQEDILLLAEHFLLKFAEQTERVVRGISHEVQELFERYSWPGNVRQLQNVIQRAVFLGESETVEVADLPFDFFQKMLVARTKAGNYHRAMEAASRALVRDALTMTRGNLVKAARLLELHPTTLRRMVNRHGLIKTEKEKSV